VALNRLSIHSPMSELVVENALLSRSN
jgi:hypothetical protein